MIIRGGWYIHDALWCVFELLDSSDSFGGGVDGLARWCGKVRYGQILVLET